MKTGDLEREFQIAAVETVYLAVLKECRYDEKVFLKMIAESGARNAAKSLLAAHHVQSGLRGLRRLGRLDLTVEHLVIQPRWSDLFTNYEREAARERLKKRVRATKSAKRGHQCEAEDCPLRLGSAK
jgi:hypothetical protein